MSATLLVMRASPHAPPGHTTAAPHDNAEQFRGAAPEELERHLLFVTFHREKNTRCERSRHLGLKAELL